MKAAKRFKTQGRERKRGEERNQVGKEKYLRKKNKNKKLQGRNC